MRRALTLVIPLLLLAAVLTVTDSRSDEAYPNYQTTPVTPGELVIAGKEGKSAGACPLKHTDVSADIAGFIARVTVTQEFTNPTREKIEAVYVFPLPENAAVDSMEMTVGKRTIVGEIHPREEAREIYQAAKDAGHVASLLDQERPNIFTQAVANIMPGEDVKITISYTQLLKYESGQYEFNFPMVVGPRYMPGTPSGAAPTGAGTAPDTSQVPDASKISPPITPKGTRTGQDISLTVSIDAGIPIYGVTSSLHEITADYPGEGLAVVKLKNKDEIPNRDFVLKYDVAGQQVQSGIIAHSGGSGNGYFALVMQPPASVKPKQITPKEMLFILDTSGSQSGEPINKSKETMFHCIKNLNPGDTFNIIAFSSEPQMLFPTSQRYNGANEKQALEYVAKCEAAGGTEILPALEPALKSPGDPQRLRIVVFLSDGYVGNDFEIIDYLQKNLGEARVFTFGIGNSVNRFLLEKMAEVGRGAADFVLLNAESDKIAAKFYDRIRNPLLTDLVVDWNGLPVEAEESYPRQLPDLFTSQPLVVKGRFTSAASGEVIIRGNYAGKPWAKTVTVEFPEQCLDNDCLASIWARSKVEALMDQDMLNAQMQTPKPEIRDEIVNVALTHRLMTQYTSFVAVEKTVITTGGQARTIAVPVEMPEGVSYEGIGDEKDMLGLMSPGRRVLSRTGTLAAGGVNAVPAAGVNLGFSLGDLSSEGDWDLRTNWDDLMNEPVPFDLDNSIVVKGDEATVKAFKEAVRQRKLDVTLRDLLTAWEKSGESGSYSKPGKLVVKDGRVEVMIWIKDASKEKLAQLDKFGVTDRAWAVEGKILMCWIAIEKLEDLAAFDNVTRVAAPSYADSK